MLIFPKATFNELESHMLLQGGFQAALLKGRKTAELTGLEKNSTKPCSNFVK